MPRPEPHHDRVVRFFNGEFGEGVYNNVRVNGAHEQGKANVNSYLALYPDGIRYFGLVPDNMGMSVAAREASTYRLSRQAPPQIIQVRPNADPAALDTLLWSMARSQTLPLGLPTCFATHMSMLSGNRKVVFWYPALVPADWMLRKFKLAAAEQ